MRKYIKAGPKIVADWLWQPTQVNFSKGIRYRAYNGLYVFIRRILVSNVVVVIFVRVYAS